MIEPPLPDDAEDVIARDVEAIARIGAVPSILRILCQHTGMGFAAVARVTGGTWTACAVQDDIGFGLLPGGRLDLHTTLCHEVRQAGRPLFIDHASAHPVYCAHHTPRLYRIESYVSVPIVLSGGAYFGNLCAIDPRPHRVSDEKTAAMFAAYAELIARQLESERVQAASAAALLDAQAAADLREQFIAVLGHDLRNPLSAIAAMAALLRARPAEPQAAEVGRRIGVATRRMARLIDDVLDLARSRLGSGIGVVLTQVADLTQALRDVVGELRIAHADREVLDDIVIASPVHCDRGRMQQLLSNLLGNALTHGSGPLPVQVHAGLDGDDLLISVTNHGEPISEDHLAHIFKPYWRAADDKPRGGLGLGLHICAQIVKAHGGTLQVRSSAETGTCFSARVPRRGPAEAPL